MADAYQLETSTDRYLLEDGSGVYLLEDVAVDEAAAYTGGGYYPFQRVVEWLRGPLGWLRRPWLPRWSM